MHFNKVLFLIAVCLLCINARVIKRQKKIARVRSQPAPARGCLSVVDLASNPLLESTYGCLGTIGCQNSCGSQNIFLEELPCNYGCGERYGILNPEVASYNHIPAIKLPNTLSYIDAGLPIPAINLPALYQCDIPSCQSRNAMPYVDLPCSQKPIYDLLNPTDVPSPMIKIPTDTIIQALLDASRYNQLPVEKCGCRQKCGCQLSVLDIPCNCQLPASYGCQLPGSCGCQLPGSCGCQLPGSCGCQLSPYDVPCGCQLSPYDVPCGCQLSPYDVPCGCQLSPYDVPCGCQLSPYDVPCSCQLPALNLPCGCQLPSLDCSCRLQAFNGPCGCQLPVSTCGCQLPVPNVPVAYQLPSLEVPRAYQLDAPCGCQLPGCGCQLSGCGCQPLPPPVVGCGKYLRQVTLPPPFL